MSAARAVRQYRLTKVAKGLRLLLAERLTEATPRERAAVEAEMARRDRMRAHIRLIVDAAPPLTAEQRDKIALLLRPLGEIRR